MLRDKNLIPLSRQHQHALALCVRIERASPIPTDDLAAWQSEIAQQWEGEIAIHFTAEEQVLFPTARRFAELSPLVEELLADHAALRTSFAQAKANQLSGEEVVSFARTLSAHIRKEERQLFEELQKRIAPETLADLGKRLDAALKDSVQACALPRRNSV